MTSYPLERYVSPSPSNVHLLPPFLYMAVFHILYFKKAYLDNDALYTFYLRLYGVGHMLKDHSDNPKRGNLLPLFHRLLFPISSNGSFIGTTPQPG